MATWIRVFFPITTLGRRKEENYFRYTNNAYVNVSQFADRFFAAKLLPRGEGTSSKRRRGHRRPTCPQAAAIGSFPGPRERRQRPCHSHGGRRRTGSPTGG